MTGKKSPIVFSELPGLFHAPSWFWELRPQHFNEESSKTAQYACAIPPENNRCTEYVAEAQTTKPNPSQRPHIVPRVANATPGSCNLCLGPITRHSACLTSGFT